MKQSEINHRISVAAERIRRFIKDNGYLWNYKLSSAKSGVDTLVTDEKRFLSRDVLYRYVGAGGFLGGVSINDGFYISALIDYTKKWVEDHVIPPQLLGEFLLDTLFGFYTQKNKYVLDEVEEWIKCCFKTCSVTGPINSFLSYHSCYHKLSIKYPKDYIPIVVSKKYQYLNENAIGVKNCDELMGKLTIMKNGINATDEEIDMLFKTPEGFDEWQMEKYGAVSYGTEKIITPKSESKTGLEMFM